MFDLTTGADFNHPILNLTPDEKHAFQYLFQQADPEEIGVIRGEIAVTFFEKTNLAPAVMGEIWQIADTENRGFLTSPAFCQALRLVGHCQNGRDPTLELASSPAPLPKFEGLPIPAAAKTAEHASLFKKPVEGLSRQTPDEQVRTHGSDEDTLLSKYWLGQVLCDQQKYSEAEGLLRQAADGQERILGRDNIDTLNSKHWLGRAVYGQQKYSEAKRLFRQVVNGQERTLGRDHNDTLATMRLIQELLLNSSPPTNNTSQQALAGRLSSFFSERQDNQEPYTDSEINEISTLLMHSNQRWGKVPRTYVVLRTIGYVNLLNELIDVGFSDHWFPVTERSLPGCLLLSVQTSFVRAQSLVLTKSMNLEKGEKGQHCYYQRGESPPFETKGVLGRGGFGQVDRVLSLISFKEYARKQVPRGLAFRGRRTEDIKLFIAEIEILKRLKHRHIVELIGSYTDSRYMALIMSPVAKMDLSAYLKRATISNHPELRTFFGCLATALVYLHEHKVRHKDIKPGNILVDRGNVLFADFGLSFDFADADGSTTMGMVNGMSPRYCAPEVAQYERRNTMSDVWSLGVVFMEIIVVLKGKTIQDMDEFLSQRGSRQAFIRANIDTLPEFIAELEGIGNSVDNQTLGWARKMLSKEQQVRPTASSLVSSILATRPGGSTSFSGICCATSEEDFTDWMDGEVSHAAY